MYSQQTGGVYSNSSAYGQSRYGGVSVSQYGYGRPSAPTPVGGTSLASGSMMSADQYSYHGRATPNSGSGAYAQYQPSYNPQHQSSSLHYAPMQHSTTSSRYSQYSQYPAPGLPSSRPMVPQARHTSLASSTPAHTSVEQRAAEFLARRQQQQKQDPEEHTRERENGASSLKDKVAMIVCSQRWSSHEIRASAPNLRPDHVTVASCAHVKLSVAW